MSILHEQALLTTISGSQNALMNTIGYEDYLQQEMITFLLFT
jgi:hypothetical protein